MFLHAVIAIVTSALQFGEIPSKYLVPSPPKEKIVAKVDGVEIKGGDVDALLWEWRGQEALADLISYQMMKGAADKQKVSVTDAEVEKELTDQIAQLNPAVTGGKPVAEYLMEQGFTKSRLWLRLKTELLLNKMAAKDFKAADYVKISTIIVRPESTSTAALANAAKKADAFYEMLQKGDSWDKVLTLSTTDQRTLDARGLVGWRRIDAFPFDVQKEFEALKAGGITKAKQTQNGFQLFKIEMFGKDAKGADLSEAETIHIGSTKVGIANKIRTSAKVEKFLQNSGGGQP